MVISLINTEVSTILLFNFLLHGMWNIPLLCIHTGEVKFLKLSGSLLSNLVKHITKTPLCSSNPNHYWHPTILAATPDHHGRHFQRLDSTCPACVPTLQVCSQCSICFSQPWNGFYNSLVAVCLGELMPATTGQPQFIIFNSTHIVVSSSVRLHVSSPLINWNIRSWRILHSCPKTMWKPPKTTPGYLLFIHFPDLLQEVQTALPWYIMAQYFFLNFNLNFTSFVNGALFSFILTILVTG